MASERRYRNSRSLSPPKGKSGQHHNHTTCDRCEQKKNASHDKSQQTKAMQENQKIREESSKYSGNGRRNSASKVSSTTGDPSSRSMRQANLVCSKHEKEKVKMQSTIDKLQEAFCEKESKLQDARSQLVRERRMSEIMERQLKNARNLSEQLGRIIHDREQEIRTLKTSLNKTKDGRNSSDVQTSWKPRQVDRKKSSSRDELHHAGMRRSSSTSEHSEFNSLASTSVDKMLKEVHSLVEGLKIKDEAIKGLQEECTRRLDKIQTLQRSVQILQDKLTQTNQHHSNDCAEKDNAVAQLQHALKEAESTVESLMCEKSKVAMEGKTTIQELQTIIQQKDLAMLKVQGQLQEALASKEKELGQMRTSMERQQKDLESKQKALEDSNEELFRSQMESESLKMELSQEKCSLNRMSEEINSLVEKLTRAAGEMENTKLEYQKKDDRLKTTQRKIKDMYLSFLGDRPLVEKIQALCRIRKEYSGRSAVSDDEFLGQTAKQMRNWYWDIKARKSSAANTQIHKRQLAELQQQVTESQTVCNILQDQLKEVTDFLDQLLHIEISPKNLSALSVIRQYGKNLPTSSNILSISKERIAPDGVSSSSQLDIEISAKQRQSLTEFRHPQSSIQLHETADSYLSQNRHESWDSNINCYRNQDVTDQSYSTFRSLSAEDVQTYTINQGSWHDPQELMQGNDTGSDSDEILLLINDRDITSDGDHQMCLVKQPSISSPPFQHGLVVKENYGSTGSINTRDKDNFASLERSASFGSFSGSVLMSYDQSEKASAEDSGLMRSRCIRSIDMMDIIQVGSHPVGLGLSSDSDIWSEPDMSLSRQRMGLCLEETNPSSNYTLSESSKDPQGKRLSPPNKNDVKKKSGNCLAQNPDKKSMGKLKRYMDRMKSYLHVFEEASFNLTDELNNLCQVRTDFLAVMSATSSRERVENLDAVLVDLEEYIRLNYKLSERVEKTIHYSRQLIEAAGYKRDPAEHIAIKKEVPQPRNKRHRPRTPAPFNGHETLVAEDKPIDIQSQLIGYHATLLSCQDMIKDLHSQLKERHCAELMNKHDLNRTVYGYLEDIDTCIEELCKKMETNDQPDPEDEKQEFVEGDIRQPVAAYPTYTVSIVDDLKAIEDRLLRFELLLNHEEEELKLSPKDSMDKEDKLNSLKHELYQLQEEHLEMKEYLEFPDAKDKSEAHSQGMVRECVERMVDRLTELEDSLRCIDEEEALKELDIDEQGAIYPPVEYKYRDEGWGSEQAVEVVTTMVPKNSDYSRDWENQDF